MSKIYKIVNDVNNKIYIGKTRATLERRFKEHCSDRTRRDTENRPLYRAMNKYGIEHFSIHLIEECPDEEASAREQYWIGFYKTYTDGYNATLGGDGKPVIDISVLLNLWEKGYCIKQIASQLGNDTKWISILLRNNGITQEEIIDRGMKISLEGSTKGVEMLDKNTEEVLNTFSSTRDAARFLIKEKGLKPSNEGGYSGHISEVCQGKRKTCQGYKWRYSHS